MFLIDTDILIWILRGNKKYEDYLQKIKYEGSLSISTITIAEIYKNVYPSEVVKTENVLAELQKEEEGKVSVPVEPGQKQENTAQAEEKSDK